MRGVLWIAHSGLLWSGCPGNTPTFAVAGLAVRQIVNLVVYSSMTLLPSCAAPCGECRTVRWVLLKAAGAAGEARRGEELGGGSRKKNEGDKCFCFVVEVRLTQCTLILSKLAGSGACLPKSTHGCSGHIDKVTLPLLEGSRERWRHLSSEQVTAEPV